jgi:lactate dehydrogenase-like 2-hydroxyacid dehydrogenase
MKPAVLVTRRIFPEAVELLRQHAEVDYADSDAVLPTEELIRRSRGKQGIVSQITDRFDAGVIDRLDTVRVIANVAVGFDNVDLAAAARRGILVTNTPDVLTDTTADLAFALLLATARRVVEADRFLRAGKWDTWAIDLLAGQDVHHSTLGIFGMGRIGQAVARRARGFSMRILYNDSKHAPAALERELGIEFADKHRLLADSDFVSLHVPLLEKTRHLIGARELSLMKRTAILINTSRGPVVDEAALADALARRAIAGAGLDVYEHEPRVHAGLLDLENVVLLPHIGSATMATRRKMSLLAAENAIAALESGRPMNLVSRPAA